MELHHVTHVTPLSDYWLQLTFDDGSSGDVDLAQLITFEGVFEPLRDLEYFHQVAVHPELFVIHWPNGADIDSDVLYSLATGSPLPSPEATRA